jgi:putative endonuclease
LKKIKRLDGNGPTGQPQRQPSLLGESKRAVSEPSDWTVYILGCADQTLYTGITNNLNHRINEHENGRGAKYTRGRAPFTLLYMEIHSSRS